MNRTWWAAVVIAAGVTAGCGAPELARGNGLGGAVAASSPADAVGDGAARGLEYTAPTGECGVTLPCGLGAEHDESTAP